MLIPCVVGTDQNFHSWYRPNFLFSFLYFPRVNCRHIHLLFKVLPHVAFACKEPDAMTFSHREYGRFLDYDENDFFYDPNTDPNPPGITGVGEGTEPNNNTNNNTNTPFVETVPEDDPDDAIETTGVGGDPDDAIETTGVKADSANNINHESIADYDYPDDTMVPNDFIDDKYEDVNNELIRVQPRNLRPRPRQRNVNRDLGFNGMTQHRTMNERTTKHKQHGSRKRESNDIKEDPYGNKKRHKEMKAYINLIVAYSNPEHATSFFIKHITLTQYGMRKGLQLWGERGVEAVKKEMR